MNKATSVYLDLCRFCAAIIVVGFHFYTMEIVSTDFRFPYGHYGVIVFFVLSGYVIAYVSDQREKDAKSYITSRFSRLYSVVIPALLIALILDYIGMHFDPDRYTISDHENIVIRIVSSLLFVNQFWNFTITPMSLGPYWSMSYEFAYYAIFAAAFYMRGRARILCIVILLATVGPRIAIYLPVWLLGSGLYYLKKHSSARSNLSYVAFFISLALFYWLTAHSTPLDSLAVYWRDALEDGYADFFGMKIFLKSSVSIARDFSIALAFGLTILFCERTMEWLIRIPFFVATVRYCASCTFAMYLFHVPLILFFDILIDQFLAPYHAANGALNQTLVWAFTLLFIFVIGRYIEKTKYIYSIIFNNAFDALSRIGKKI